MKKQKSISIDQEVYDAISDYRFAQKINSENVAICNLLKFGLQKYHSDAKKDSKEKRHETV